MMSLKGRWKRADFAALAALTLFALALCWPVLLGKVPVAADTLYLWAPWSKLPHAPVRNSALADSSLLYLPWAAFERASLASGEWPQWDPYSFAGASFAANSQNQLYYPLTWLLWLLPLSGSIQLLALFNLSLAGWGMYAFCRLLGATQLGSLIGGLVFAGSGMMQLALEAPGVASVYGWLPWMLFATEMALSRKSALWTAVAILICALQTVAGNLQWVLYSYFAVGCWIAWRAVPVMDRRLEVSGHRRILLASSWRSTWQTLLRGALILTAALVLSTVHLTPFLELSSLAGRTGGQVSSHSPPLSTLLRLVMPQFFGTAAPGIGTPMVFNDLWYVGIPALLLASVAVVRRAHRSVGFWLALATFAILVAFGIGPFLYIRWLPGLSALLPSRIGYLLITSLSVLAALGLGAWLRIAVETPRRAFLWLGALALALAGALLAGLLLRNAERDAALQQLMGEQLWRGAVISLISLAALALWPLLSLKRTLAPRSAPSIRAALPLLLTLLVAADLITSVPGYNSFVSPDALVPVTPALLWLRAQPGNGRLLGLDAGGVTFNPNTQMLYGFSSVEGYDSLHTRRYEEFWGAVDAQVRPVARGNPYSNVSVRPQAYTSTLADLLNVSYIASSTPISIPTSYTPSYNGEIYIYKNGNALPRAFLLTQAKVLSTGQVRAELASPQFDPGKVLLLEADEQPPQVTAPTTSAPGSVQITDYKRNSVVVEAQVNTNAWLVLADANYPGWRAAVDGYEQQIYTADYLLRSVPLAPGRHRIIFTFAPTTLLPGGILSAGSLALLILFIAGRLPFRRFRSQLDNT